MTKLNEREKNLILFSISEQLVKLSKTKRIYKENLELWAELKELHEQINSTT